jgi:glycosyltransferase involved in cell wall biosynthesis
MSVIVPARDAEETLPATLEGLAEQAIDEEFEVVVVDDGSRDATADLAERSPVVDRVVRADGAGPAAARNLGVAAAQGDALAFTDADCRPTPGWLAAGRRALEDADLVQGMVRAVPDVEIGPYDRTLWVLAPWGLFEGANLFVRRELYERIGGFERWVPPGGKDLGEDAWFGWRARRAQARTAFCDEALVHHWVFPRGPGEFVAENARRRFFPRMAVLIPELRDNGFFYRRWFLSSRTAAFDAALAGVAVAALRRNPLALAAAVPYARLVAGEARKWGRRRAPEVAAANVAADVVGAAALVRGSLEARAPLL